ncbi:hypothetical protein BZM27_37370 [Paraburkholderia steynii]|uniref:Histidine kinase domain-containing protein n=1 Tax=Paraburkholderia steynii TaxID=1245441 RepID=A0A4R0X7S3_9BURK|nr:hypothetical protein BZM27_37370 [Paraburkholderia steynii]
MRQALHRIVNDGSRAGDVIGRIRQLIRKAPPRKETVDLNKAIREVIELTRGETVKHGASVQTQLADGLPFNEGDRVGLQQVLLNLIINAIEAMSDVSDGAREVLISTGNADADRVLVTVRDSGPGLAPDSTPSMFSPRSTQRSPPAWEGAVDLPFDRRGPRRPIVGERERASRRDLSIHGARPPRCSIVIAVLHSGINLPVRGGSRPSHQNPSRIARCIQFGCDQQRDT